MPIAMKLKDWMQVVVTVALVSALAACGGGGDSGSSSSGSSGGGSGGQISGSLPSSPTQQPIAATAANTVAITVAHGATGVINIPAISVTVCAPNSPSTCQTIDNVQVDTGSFGLRIVNSALNSSMQNALTKNTTTTGANLAECAGFADGFTWGSVRNAIVKVGGETTSAAGVPVQIIGDMTGTPVPSPGCSNGTQESTVSDLGANGIIGIGTALNDCGQNCSDPTLAPTYSNYFGCPAGASCARTAVAATKQVANPVANFTADNNGVIVQLPPISNSGAASATGTLVFGVGTQSNNALTGAQSFTTDGYGNMANSSFNGSKLTAFLDSGSNGYFFNDSSITLCDSNGNFRGFYCPSAAQTRTVTLVGNNNVQAAVGVGVVSASTLFGNGTSYAFNDLAGQVGGLSAFDLGLPFFYGRHVYYGYDLSASGGQTPYVAF
ncbi:MAG TPA: DUF3443 family protein [Paraburkholderia sp.]|uniref:DUF3443 family protein n=1 Tax=Paraburkholderia sp. TaxID=1926495 RepID=UPI002ED62D9C